MTQLYQPETFDPLTDTPWDEGRVKDAIQRIVVQAENAFDDETLWPSGEWESWENYLPLKSLYLGASGVVWALHALRKRGRADGTLDLAHAITRTHEEWQRQPDLMRDVELPSTAEAALLTGESGILTVAWLVEPTQERADRLLARVRENADSEAIEFMWGSPGTMKAAAELYGITGEDRWRDAWRESADILLEKREEDGLWTKTLYGEQSRSLTPPHGLTGILCAVQNTELHRDANAVLRRNAVVEDGFANWPTRDKHGLEAPDGETRLQWCCGAPGIVLAAADYLDEDLLLAGAELIWHAGAHGDEKGPGICHGTAGNGYALLRTFQRTQDERWLDRARRFAMHALEQVERREPRYSLFTGDLGAALFASDCIDARASYPILEAWE